MTRPTAQTCRFCGEPFVGSDALGKPCPRCFEIPTELGSLEDYLTRENVKLDEQKPISVRRNELQIVSNELDLAVFRVARRLREFGAEHRDNDVLATAEFLEARRRFVRAYMHPTDVERTQ